MHVIHKFAVVALTLSPAACASETGSESGVGTDTDSQSGGDGDDVGSGSSDSGSESGVSTGSAGDGDGSGGSEVTEDGTETMAGDGDGDSNSNTSSGGDGDGDGTGDGDGDGAPGSDKFPGDLCDPFIDTCISFEGNDYVCALDNDWLGGDEYEYNFKCMLFLDLAGPGTSGSMCNSSSNECQTGYYCAGDWALDPGTCEGFGKCCATLCVYEDTCGGGEECAVKHFQATLTDYLDVYTGIGFCPSG